MTSLGGKVANLTGASIRIGKSVAERLASEGASIVITYAKSADKASVNDAGSLHCTVPSQCR